MEVKVSAIHTGKHSNNELVTQVLNKPNSSNKALSNRDDVKREVKRLLISKNLSVEDIITKYSQIVYQEIENVKVSDIVNVLKNIEILHGLHNTNSDTNELNITLSTKNPEELEEYLNTTLLNTKNVITRIQARRINKQST